MLHILSLSEELSRLQIMPSLHADCLVSKSAMHYAVHGFLSPDFLVSLFRPSVRSFTPLLGDSTLTSVPPAPRVRRGLNPTWSHLGVCDTRAF